MKTDSQLHTDVMAELQWDPQLRDTEIGIAVKTGVVTLSGIVRTLGQKLEAQRAVLRVGGVRAVADDLEVRPVGATKVGDTDIAHAAVNSLRWHTEVPDDRVTVKVDNGWVTLSGNVSWWFQSDASERAVRYLNGVRGVTNLVKVVPAISEKTVSAKIESALKRSAELDAKAIQVEALDGKVVLKGTVHSWAERRDAERAAWASPGVKQVEDLLVVGV